MPHKKLRNDLPCTLQKALRFIGLFDDDDGGSKGKSENANVQYDNFQRSFSNKRFAKSFDLENCFRSKEQKEISLLSVLCRVAAGQDIEQVIYDPANSILRPLSCPALYNTCLIIVLLNITLENWYMRSLSSRCWIRSRFVTT